MQNLDSQLSERLRQAMLADESVLHKFVSASGDLAVNLVVAAVILVITFWAAGWAARVVRGLIDRVQHTGPADTTLQSFGASLARYAVIVVGFVAILQQLGVQTTSILAVLGAASLAIGLAIQGTLSNVAAGAMLLLLRPYRVGDVVEISGRVGVVHALDLFVTELTTPDNVKVVLPNGKVFGDVIVNMSFHDRRRVDVVFRLPLHNDMVALLAGLRQRAILHPLVLQEPPPTVEVVGIGDLFVEGAVRVWVDRPNYQAVRADFMQAAKLLADGAEAPLPPPSLPKEAPPHPPKRRFPPGKLGGKG
ncbi:MAG: mechanosensitive ion channel family protein [Caulobacteraceae bacterium]